MNCPEDMIEIMHEFLDEDIEPGKEQKLKEHLSRCTECLALFNDLKATIKLLQNTSSIQAPENFTEKIMASLPKEKKKTGIRRWLKIHPFISAASLFIFLIMSSFILSWNEERQFSVSNQKNLIVLHNTVIVPQGKVVNGDVVVQNGKLKIEGEVKGDVIVINGKESIASAGHVTGHIEEVNQLFAFIWYDLKRFEKDAMHLL